MQYKMSAILEKKFNIYGQEQHITNFDKIIKIGDSFLQVRLIRTKHFRGKDKSDGTFTAPMPRAKFIHLEELEDPYYLVKRSDVLKAQEKK